MSNEAILTPDAFKIDARHWCRQIEAFILERYSGSRRAGIVVPISGGLDSSVVAALCTRAIGADKVIGLMLPERMGNPETDRYGLLIAKHLGIKTMKINISPILRGLGTSNPFLSAISGRERWKGAVAGFLRMRDQTVKSLYMDALEGKSDASSRKWIAAVSAKQRARLLAAYKVAEERNMLLAGSSHRTEQLTGLFVKYGIDDGADIMPLKNIYRSQILQLAEYIEIPPEILLRPPNPDILPGITDKYMGYFGIDYLNIDLILLGLQKELSADDIALQLGLDIQIVRQVLEMVKLSQNSRSHALAPDLE